MSTEPEYFLQFNLTGHEKSIAVRKHLVKKLLPNAGFIIYHADADFTKFRMTAGFDRLSKILSVEPSLILVRLQNDVLLRQAERHRLRKLLRPDASIYDSTDSTEEFRVSQKHRFVHNLDGEFLLPHERLHLTDELVEQLQADAYFRQLLPSCRIEEPVLHCCRRLGILVSRGPLHLHQWSFERVKRSPKRCLLDLVVCSGLQVPGDSLRGYFGEAVAFYFEWMAFSTRWLIVPGLFGLLLTIFSWWTAVQEDVLPGEYEPSASAVKAAVSTSIVDRNPYVPFFAFSMVIWGFLYIKCWKRRTAELACSWDTGPSHATGATASGRLLSEPRPTFYGAPRRNPVTHALELHYPQWRRRIKYCVSACVTAVMLGVALLFMFASLNLQGLVDKKNRWGEHNPFHMSALAALAQPGCLLDPKGALWILPVLLHSSLIVLLNQYVYRCIAEKLTDWENHATERQHENALIIKRFLFDAFDCYVALFYLAFYELDVSELRTALISLYTTDCARRLCAEAVLPLLKYAATTKMRQRSYLRHKRDDGDVVDLKQETSIGGLLAEICADEYDEFDDYLEMVIQYGYVMLFASAFPLAALLSAATNLVEIRSDAFKLCVVYRRPRVRRVNNLGTWLVILQALTWLSVLTNCFIFGFSSEQLLQWTPSLFAHVRVADGRLEQELVAGGGRYAVALVMTLEHVLLLLGLLIHYAVEDVPVNVRQRLQRWEWLRTEALRGLSQDGAI